MQIDLSHTDPCSSPVLLGAPGSKPISFFKLVLASGCLISSTFGMVSSASDPLHDLTSWKEAPAPPVTLASQPFLSPEVRRA